MDVNLKLTVVLDLSDRALEAIMRLTGANYLGDEAPAPAVERAPDAPAPAPSAPATTEKRKPGRPAKAKAEAPVEPVVLPPLEEVQKALVQPVLDAVAATPAPEKPAAVAETPEAPKASSDAEEALRQKVRDALLAIGPKKTKAEKLAILESHGANSVTKLPAASLEAALADLVAAAA